MRNQPIVAIDGPAASGKSTTARAVAEALGFTHFDSGAVYRALTYLALEDLGAPEAWSEEAIVQHAAERGLSVTAEQGTMHVRIAGVDPGDHLRSEGVNREVSRVAAMPQVRAFVNGLLRAGAALGGVVMDGRDIGTVVFPDAEVKIFMVADAEERARRRLRERGQEADEPAVRRESGVLTARDTRDSTRLADPLRPAPDAVQLDNTRLTFAEQVRTVVDLARKASRG